MTPHVVQARRVDSVPLAVVRRRASPPELARLVPECCGLIWAAVRAQQARAGRHVAIYRDGASATHFGPYAGLGAAHDAVRRWCTANARPLAGPSWEIYGHWQPEWDADPSRIRTDVYYLLADVQSGR